MCALTSRRLALRPASGEALEIERTLATARAVLAISFLLAFYSEPTAHVSETTPLSGWLLLYAAHSISLFILSRLQRDVSRSFSYWVHATDVVFAVIICLLAGKPDSPFFLLSIFALLAAAFRWGMRQALLTMIASVAAIAGATVLAGKHSLDFYATARPDLYRLVPGAVYLVIFAFLIGYLAESEKRRRAEVLSISQVSSKVRVDGDLEGTLQAIFQETLRLFGASQVVLVSGESDTQLTSLCRGELLKGNADLVFSGRQLDGAESYNHLFPLPELCAGAAWRKGRRDSVAAVDQDGSQLRKERCELPAGFVNEHAFDLVLASNISFAPDISGRIFLFGPRLGGSVQSQLRLFQQLTSRVAPAVYNVYLLRRLRSRAAAVERARLARELHDGVVQSLHAIAFRLYALRTGSTIDYRERDKELLDIQELIQNEAGSIRTLIQQLKPLNFDNRRLVDFLSGMIERYRFDTGMAARFISDVGEVMLPPQTCREIAGIVQEALANVLKHSGAEKVLVRLGSREGRWILTIEDDGRGFEFGGCLPQTELDRTRRGPVVIKERVRAIGGELTIESRPGQGARLEITFPRVTNSNLT